MCPFGQPFRLSVDEKRSTRRACAVLLFFYDFQRFSGQPDPQSARAGAVETLFSILAFAPEQRTKSDELESILWTPSGSNFKSLAP